MLGNGKAGGVVVMLQRGLLLRLQALTATVIQPGRWLSLQLHFPEGDVQLMAGHVYGRGARAALRKAASLCPGPSVCPSYVVADWNFCEDGED
eukprot:573371-Lingulodinium_polyedra.AAC.1